MLFRDTIQEYEFDCCSRKMAPRAVGGYIKMLGYLADYLEQNHKITELEEIKGIHIKKFLMEKEKLGRKPSYINDLLKVYKTFFRYCLNEEYLTKSPTMNVHNVRQPKVLIDNRQRKRYSDSAVYDANNYETSHTIYAKSQARRNCHCNRQSYWLEKYGFNGKCELCLYRG